MKPAVSHNLAQRVNVGDSLTRSAVRWPAQRAIVEGARSWTYAEFDAWVNRLANGLIGLGYKRGDVLALASGNSAEFLAVYYACAKLGVVCVPINLGWRVDEVVYVLDHSRARGLVAESQLVYAMAEAVSKVSAVVDLIVAPGTGASADDQPGDQRWLPMEEVLADHATVPEVLVEDRDPLSYLYTSGTTSFPKGVVGSHLAIYLESMSAALDSGWRADDRFIAMLPLFHTAQLNAFCTPACGCRLSCHLMRPGSIRGGGRRAGLVG